MASQSTDVVLIERGGNLYEQPIAVLDARAHSSDLNLNDFGVVNARGVTSSSVPSTDFYLDLDTNTGNHRNRLRTLDATSFASFVIQSGAVSETINVYGESFGGSLEGVILKSYGSFVNGIQHRVQNASGYYSIIVGSNSNIGSTAEQLRATSTGVCIGNDAPAANTKLDIRGPMRLQRYTISNVPPANSVPNGTYSEVASSFCRSNGTNWRKVSDNTIVA